MPEEITTIEDGGSRGGSTPRCQLTRTEIRRLINEVEAKDVFPIAPEQRDAIVRVLMIATLDPQVPMRTRVGASRALMKATEINLVEREREYRARCADAGLPLDTGDRVGGGVSITLTQGIIQQIAADPEYQEYCRQRAVAMSALLMSANVNGNGHSGKGNGSTNGKH